MYAASGPWNLVLSGTSTAPAEAAESMATIQLVEFGAQMATASPASIPEAIRAAAARDPSGQLGVGDPEVALHHRFGVGVGASHSQQERREGVGVVWIELSHGR